MTTVHEGLLWWQDPTRTGNRTGYVLTFHYSVIDHAATAITVLQSERLYRDRRDQRLGNC